MSATGSEKSSSMSILQSCPSNFVAESEICLHLQPFGFVIAATAQRNVSSCKIAHL